MCLPRPNKNRFLQPVLPEGPSFSSITVGHTHTHTSAPPHSQQLDPWQLPSPIITNPQGRLVKALVFLFVCLFLFFKKKGLVKAPRVPHKSSDCWAHGNSPKMFSRVLEPPAWKSPAAGTSFFQAATPNCLLEGSASQKGSPQLIRHLKERAI